MPCDPHYLRPKGELTVRFCYVNFDGAKALSKSIETGRDKALNMKFMMKYCKETVDGVEV